MIWIVSEITFAEEVGKDYFGKVVGVFDNREAALSYMREKCDNKNKAHHIQGWEINETID